MIYKSMVRSKIEFVSYVWMAASEKSLPTCEFVIYNCAMKTYYQTNEIVSYGLRDHRAIITHWHYVYFSIFLFYVLLYC